ncbi:hypothetical protein SAMN04488074_1126 [Lentzea albidocapillata subsp. violacea]|uniref:Uncharacterized protein n=1 Tax=Lentzea albidocapillata subsp. violacea TaxID=128104 RepID=A0A1G9LAW4_9PSEU|nr:hypothetical protein [Lentzea albidocapillata]SDL59119.1 hypothetical protein SAMN04488074_1126 [Lentzea albidocapillata subsp. violacea]
MTNPQDPNPWQPSPDIPQAQPGATAGTYEVTAVNNMGLPMPQAPELAPPLDHGQWQNPAGWQNPYPAAPGGHYQVNQVAQASYPMTPVQSHELPPARPATINAAMWIWIAGALLSVAVLPVMLLVNADFLLTQDSVVTAEERRAGEIGVRAMAVIFGFMMLVAAAPYVAFAIVLRNGQNWARILLTILGGLGIVSMIGITFISIGSQVWQPSVAICIVVIGLTIAAIVLQFLPASNRFVR